MSSDKTADILGTTYKITYKRFSNKDLDGTCSYSAKTIEIRLDNYYQVENFKAIQDRALRHEIIHAFLCESGLSENSNSCEAWAVNEEMVDWFAIQSPKIFETFKELNIV